MDARPQPREFVPRPEYVDGVVHGIQTKDLAPYPVRCLRPERDEMAVIIGALPGERPATLKDKSAPENGDEDQLMRWAPPMIEKWVAVQAEDGSWVCPAFSFADEPAPGLIPGRELTYVDLRDLTLTLMRLGGYVGGAASASFSRQ